MFLMLLRLSLNKISLDELLLVHLCFSPALAKYTSVKPFPNLLILVSSSWYWSYEPMQFPEPQHVHQLFWRSVTLGWANILYMFLAFEKFHTVCGSPNQALNFIRGGTYKHLFTKTCHREVKTYSSISGFFFFFWLNIRRWLTDFKNLH